ncbi:MAG: 16S rRNA (guanine(527)-N(7))-methyltransferase RsmG [Nitrosomonadaceae bacterium]|nr:16S rRNA (guanine(527)-N(7))-methyltransferase RsmG [Nitrosomonadaceae bacterium]
MSAVVNIRDNPVDSAATSDANLALRLQAGVTALGLSLSQQQQQQLLDYIALLDKWNKVYNLTAVREPERMLGLHILDSLSMVPHLGQAKTVLDVGTGGGLPGICIAVARPDLNVVMLDSLQKKTTFVRQAIGALGLTNASVVCERVEAFRPAQPFDVVTSRAFAELSDFVKGAGHLMRPGGRMLAMKGVYPHDEIARAFSSPEASHKVVDVHTLNVPQVDGQRHLVVIEAKTI